MVNGQELDLKYEALAATEEQLRLIHRNKTGALINAAVQMGAAAAQAITPGRMKPMRIPRSAAATAADKIRLPMPGFSGGKRRRPYPAAAASRASPPQNRIV